MTPAFCHSLLDSDELQVVLFLLSGLSGVARPQLLRAGQGVGQLGLLGKAATQGNDQLLYSSISLGIT